jgi:hypothetical protein
MGCQTTAYDCQKLITINKFYHRTRGFKWTIFFRPVTVTSYLTINVPNIEPNLNGSLSLSDFQLAAFQGVPRENNSVSISYLSHTNYISEFTLGTKTSVDIIQL